MIIGDHACMEDIWKIHGRYMEDTVNIVANVDEYISDLYNLAILQPTFLHNYWIFITLQQLYRFLIHLVVNIEETCVWKI